MSYTEFYCDSVSGSNLNGGSDSGSPSMSDTAGTGAWVSTTQHYVSVTKTGSITVGQWISFFKGSDTVPTTTARITNVSGGGALVWTITVSNTSYTGTQPSSLTTASNFKAIVGGAWKGPNGASDFPFEYLNATATDTSGHLPRVNLKNNGPYSVTATIMSNESNVTYQGCTSTAGDGGRATIDGGGSGVSYTLIDITASPVTIADLIFNRNGATSNAVGVLTDGGLQVILQRVTSSNMAGGGFAVSGGNGGSYAADECEAFGCGGDGFSNAGGTAVWTNCISHDNTGNNQNGFSATNFTVAINCIADSNSGKAFYLETSSNVLLVLDGCTSYNNADAGVDNAGGTILGKNLLLVNNTTYGVVNNDAGGAVTNLVNCGFNGNTPGQVFGANIQNAGALTLASQPMNDPANGDFSLVTGSAAVGAGNGNFEQNSGSYTKTCAGHPDLGAVQTLVSSNNSNKVSDGKSF